MWEEFTQDPSTLISETKGLAKHTLGKRKQLLYLIRVTCSQVDHISPAMAGTTVTNKTRVSTLLALQRTVALGVPAAKPTLKTREEVNKRKRFKKEKPNMLYPNSKGSSPTPCGYSRNDTRENFQPLPMPGKVVKSVAQDGRPAGPDPVNNNQIIWMKVSLPLLTLKFKMRSQQTADESDDLWRSISLDDNPSEANKEKTDSDTEAESMVSVTIQQDTSVIAPMTSPVIGPVPRPDSPNVHSPLPTTTTITSATTKITLPLPPQPQQGPSDPIIIKRMGELEELIANPEIDRKINESVKEVVISSIKHAMRAPLHARFKDLPTSDMKEILLQRMLEENYDKGYADHRAAYEALTLLHHNPSLIHIIREVKFTSTAALSSSKTAASAEYSAWTTTDTRIKPSITTIPDDLYMDDETTADEQAYSRFGGVKRVPPLENSLLAQTGDIATFMDWYCKRQGISELTPKDLEGPAYEIVKAFHPDVVHTHSSNGRRAIIMPLHLRGEPDQHPYLSQEEGAFYPDVGLEQLVPDQFWIEEECKYDIAVRYSRSGKEKTDRPSNSHRILIVYEIAKSFSILGTIHEEDLIRERDELKDYVIAEMDSSNICTLVTFEDVTYSMKRMETTTDQRVFVSTRTNPRMNTRFWTQKDVVRSKEFMFAIQKRLKTRRIFRNLESFVGGRIREGDYRRSSMEPSDTAAQPRLSYSRSHKGFLFHFSLEINTTLVVFLKSEELPESYEVLIMKMEDPSRANINKLLEILLKMNLPDHRSVLMDLEDQVMVEMEIPRSSGVNSQPHAHT
ncbi:hypothetical protein Tco_0439174 [Tanacetum coccineum]